MERQWGELFDKFFDAAVDTDIEAVGREEILAHMEGGTLLPGRYLYSSDAGANNWIRLCNDPKYRHHRETVDFWANSGGQNIADLIQGQLGGREDLDYISLGPGAGEKDSELVRKWLDSGMDIFYYPYDISRPLVSRAVHKVRDGAPPNSTSRLRVKAVLGDFNHLKSLVDVFRHRDAPNVISLLGSLGNLENERQFLLKLYQQMSSYDILILEVRLQSEGNEPAELVDGDAALRFDFGPLEIYLGLRFNRKLMTIKRERHVSSINDTITTIVGCENVKYRGVTYPETKLIYIHQYKEAAFLSVLKDIGFHVICNECGKQSEDFLVCVVHKKARRRTTAAAAA
jgi:hypothetical protein